MSFCMESGAFLDRLLEIFLNYIYNFELHKKICQQASMHLIHNCGIMLGHYRETWVKVGLFITWENI